LLTPGYENEGTFRDSWRAKCRRGGAILKIVILYDASVQNAPAGFKIAVEAAVRYFDHLIADRITVPITFSYGELNGHPVVSGALAQSSTNGNIETYASVVGRLTASANSLADFLSVGTLPGADPTNGARYWVSDAQAKVYGLGS